MTANTLASTALQFEVSDQVATLTFNSPAKRNALEMAMRDGLVVALRHIQQNKDIRAVVLTGAGGHFCAGGDLKNMAEVQHENGAWLSRMQTLHEWVQILLTLDRPVMIDETDRSPDGPPTPLDLGYEARIRGSASSAQGLLGPLDGGWTVQ